ncbi:2'-5' RNA ligase [Pseudoalteromonas luteoviolacea]|uniref:RNA 2',3'-cyclic phosphodiesterase n=1 Tax=Pseudoalteromonas luteoviolacea TaxID=43657 RepID=A0A1C0TL13_9GAMM|nr:RNA 2',3'-cyclic phosphodiesterase [Pseudoalteromonas luteoviolacea]OCQ19221.1 2'-5' RNA ligase [Pseudoalteromonas luteoviolacea]
MATRRLFFGIGLDEQATSTIQQWLSRSVAHHQPPTLARNWHITLAFLAQVDTPTTDALIEFAEQLKGAPFELQFSQSGYWAHNGIFYLPPAPSDALGSLAAPLRALSEQWQLYTNPYPYSPHITLFRNHKPTPQVRAPMTPFTLTVTKFHLYHSHSSQDGLHYTPIASFGLSA